MADKNGMDLIGGIVRLNFSASVARVQMAAAGRVLGAVPGQEQSAGRMMQRGMEQVNQRTDELTAAVTGVGRYLDIYA